MVILLSLAATSIIGTVIPQNEAPDLYLRNYGDFLFSIFNALGVFDLYHSGWFRFLLCLLIINLSGLLHQPAEGDLENHFPQNASVPPGRFKNTGNRQEWTADAPIEKLKNLFQSYVAGHFSVHRMDATKNGFMIFGEKGTVDPIGGVCRAYKRAVDGGRRIDRIDFRI